MTAANAAISAKGCTPGWGSYVSGHVCPCTLNPDGTRGVLSKKQWLAQPSSGFLSGSLATTHATHRIAVIRCVRCVEGIESFQACRGSCAGVRASTHAIASPATCRAMLTSTLMRRSMMLDLHQRRVGPASTEAVFLNEKSSVRAGQVVREWKCECSCSRTLSIHDR